LLKRLKKDKIDVMGRKAWNSGITKAKSKPCICGCGEFVRVHKYKRKNSKGYNHVVSDYIKGHSSRGINGFDPKIHSPRLCGCGCGKLTGKFKGKFNHFIKGHENIGRIPWNKGIPFSEESRKKMSLSHLKLQKEPANKVYINKKKLYKYYVLEKKSARVVAEIMDVSYDATKNRLKKLGWSRTTKDACTLDDFKKKMRKVRVKELSLNKKINIPNKLERIVYEELDKYNIPYKKQEPLFEKFVVDALFPEKKIVLEIFGKYWHTMPKIVQKDISKKKYLEKCGYKVVELWDYEIHKDGVEKKIKNFIKKYELV
jgi:very-short-patch-repair endonuclease